MALRCHRAMQPTSDGLRIGGAHQRGNKKSVMENNKDSRLIYAAAAILSLSYLELGNW